MDEHRRLNPGIYNKICTLQPVVGLALTTTALSATIASSAFVKGISSAVEVRIFARKTGRNAMLSRLPHRFF
jgi:hypothetical protein